MKKQPIGVFDSGIGGTSILREIVKLLPHEDFIYLADSANAPYGEKSSNEIIDLCKKNVDYLLSQNCKLIVVACNTATTNAINILRSIYSIPFIGIEPAIKPAILNTKTNTIGVLATKGTLTSKLFAEKINIYSQENQIIEVVGKGLVELLEQGDFSSTKLVGLVTSYVKPMLDKKIDYLVLGCSHYPYLLPILKKITPKSVKIIDSGEAVARQTFNVLKNNCLLELVKTKGSIVFCANSNINTLKKICKKHFDNFKIKCI